MNVTALQDSYKKSLQRQSQDSYKFLSNCNSKSHIILFLSNSLEKENIQINHAVDDADLIIVKTGLE